MRCFGSAFWSDSIVTPKYDLPVAVTPWPVPRAGFEWVKKSGKPIDKSASILLPVEELPVSTVDAADKHPALYRVFSNVQATSDGIREFANTFGTLGVTLDVMAYHSNQPWEPNLQLAS